MNERNIDDITNKAREAIVEHVKTDEVIIEKMIYKLSGSDGLTIAKVQAYVGNPRNGLQQFDIKWVKDEQRFEILGGIRHFKPQSLRERFKPELNRFKLEKMTLAKLVCLLIKANKRRKLVEQKWKKKAHRYRDDFIRERDAQARTCANFRKYMDEAEAREDELRQRENEAKQWRDHVDELVNRQVQKYKDLYAAQECSCCEEKRWRRKYRETYSGMSEFCGKYINIVDDMMRQKNLPDNVKARLCDMRIAFVESREFLDKVMKEESNLED